MPAYRQNLADWVYCKVIYPKNKIIMFSDHAANLLQIFRFDIIISCNLSWFPYHISLKQSGDKLQLKKKFVSLTEAACFCTSQQFIFPLYISNIRLQSAANIDVLYYFYGCQWPRNNQNCYHMLQTVKNAALHFSSSLSRTKPESRSHFWSDLLSTF